MKKLYILLPALLALFCLPEKTFAQTPPNDDCFGLIDLGTAPSCPPDTFNNVNATPTDIGNDNAPSCFNGNTADHDVWFAFTCPDTLFDFRITVTGVGANPLQQPEFAIYRGDCEFDGLAELLCGIAMVGENEVYIDVQNLTPGIQYFIRVSDWSQTAAPNWGDFVLCVAPIPPASNVDDGGSNLCEGILYDTGGPDEDYSPNEDNTFVICPPAPTGCITFTMEYFNIESPGGFLNGNDILTFYDGNSTSAPVIASLNGPGFGLTDIAGGGGVCFKLQASSGCLTVNFQSDASLELEGWKGHWQCSALPCTQPETMDVALNVPADSIVSAVQTPATTVTVTNINCPENAYGTFKFATDDNDLGLKKGLLLTSGAADIAIGPNNLPSAGIDNLGLGDADLDYLSVLTGNGAESHNACVVELDVFAATNELSFEYVFGSDEYPEYANSNFNDIFAFLVSGPGIVGDPNLNNAVNIATIPGSLPPIPVQINDVNNIDNWQYYRNNELSPTLQYDGLTSDFLGVKKSLTARTEVIPCNTYHLKLAVADRFDGVFDSGVFVSEIRGGTPDLVVQFTSGIQYFTEDCSNSVDFLKITLPEALDMDASFIVTLGGTATLGIDYLLTIPTVITFPAGQTQLLFPITPISDGLVEGTETITISLSNNFGCGTVLYKTIVVKIQDHLTVDAGPDTLFVCEGGTLQLDGDGAANYFWAPPGLVSNPFIADPTITPTQDVWLEVTGTLFTCVDVDSVFIKIIAPSIDVTTQGPINICQGTQVPLSSTNNVNNSGLVWTPAAGLNDPNSPNPIATPTVSTTYTASVTIAGCSVSDQITINVDTLFFPTLLLTDTTICQNYPVQLAKDIQTTTDYQWTPSLGLNDATIAGPLALPDVTTTYTLVATSANGYCSQTASILVNVIAADVDIQGVDSTEICLGTSVPLNASFAPPSGSTVVTWSPSFYVSNPTGPNTVASPDESVTIFATYNINGCIVRDSVHFRVDSLPDQAIRREEDKSVYCPGDTVYLISKTYEPASFPDIMHAWLPFQGQLTPVENWNMVILADTTHIFQRITNNHACIDTAEVEVVVGEQVQISATADPDLVCPGFPSQLQVTVTPAGTAIEWMPNPALPCTNCPNPVVAPLATTTFTVSTPTADCPASASVTVNVLPAPLLALPSNPTTICLGDEIQLNSTDESAQGVSYSWTSSTGTFSSIEAMPIDAPTVGTTYYVLAHGPQCDSQDSVTVIPVFATIEAGSDQTICFGGTAVLNAVTTGTPGTVQWQPGNLSTPSVTVQPSDTTAFSVVLTYGPGCSASDFVLVNVLPSVQLSTIQATPDTSSYCEGTPVSLSISVNPSDAHLIWTENGQNLSFTTDSITLTPHPLQGDSIATYVVTATTDEGCTGTSTPLQIKVKRCIVIPNAFTPGNDSDNETFGLVLTGGDVELLGFSIYNRWGQRVFKADSNTQRWDGKTDGSPAPSDVYVYYMTVRYANGDEQEFKGEVTLLR